MSLEDMKMSISGYATAKGKPYEAIAEAITDVYSNGEKAQPLSLKLFEIMKNR